MSSLGLLPVLLPGHSQEVLATGHSTKPFQFGSLLITQQGTQLLSPAGIWISHTELGLGISKLKVANMAMLHSPGWMSAHTSHLSNISHFRPKSICVSHKPAIISISLCKLQAGDTTNTGLRLYRTLLPCRVGEIPTAGNICCYFGVAAETSLILSALVTSDQGKGRGYAESKAGWETPC